MKKKMFCFLMIAVLVATFLPMNSHAYSTSGNKLDKNNQMLYFVHAGFSTATFNAVNDSMYKWYQASGYNLMKRDPTIRHSLSDFEDNSSRDRLNLIYRIGVGTTEYVALNRTRFQNNIIFESDININISHDFANSAQPGCYDSYSVILHELGHTIGLNDISSPTTSVMYERGSLNATKRNLTTDDVNGAKAIY